MAYCRQAAVGCIDSGFRNGGKRIRLSIQLSLGALAYRSLGLHRAGASFLIGRRARKLSLSIALLPACSLSHRLIVKLSSWGVG